MSIFSHHSHYFSKRGHARGGFTLIELLVVVAMVGILSTIVLTNVNAGRVKARDQIRLKDMDSIQASVEEYYRDNGHYPISNCQSQGAVWTAYAPSYWSTFKTCPSVGMVGTQSLAQTLSPYLLTPLKDPLNGEYIYGSDDGVNYCILFSGVENFNNVPSKYIDRNRCPTTTSDGKCGNSSGAPAGGSNWIFYPTGGAIASWC